MRHRKLTKAEIEEGLEQVADGMVNAAFARDGETYYKLLEQRVELQQALRELNLLANQPALRSEQGLTKI